MPRDLKLVVARPFGAIAHQIHSVSQRQHQSPVRYRLRQPEIAVVRRLEQIEMFPSDPPLCLRLRKPAPGKSCSGLGLIYTIHPHRVVHGGAAKQLPLSTLRSVTASSGIEQQIVTMARQGQTQGVGVAVATTLRAHGPAIYDELRCGFLRRQKIQARRLEGCGTELTWARLKLVPHSHSLRPNQPDRLLPQWPGHSFVVASIEQDRARG